MPVTDCAFYAGEWLVEPALYRLSRNGEVTVLEPKVMQVLAHLAEHPDQLVDRDELLATVWAGTFVTDHVLNRSISQLRKVFEDNPRDPRFIETIPKAGYRLIAPIRRVGKDGFAEDGLSADGAPSGGMPDTVEALYLRPSAPSGRGAPDVPGRAAPGRTMGLAVLALVIVVGLLAFAFLRAPNPGSRILESFPFTSFTGQERDPALSPDGNYVAFVWNQTTDEDLDLYVKLVGTGEPLRLTQTPGRERAPTWAPDGRHLAFIRSGQSECGIFIMPALGGDERRLSECTYMISAALAWSPDGQWLLFGESDGPNKPYRLVQLSPETLERRILTDPPYHFFGDRDPAISPDGRLLVFTRSYHPWTKDLFVMPMDGDTPRRLTTFNRDIRGVTWNADGQQLIFSINLGGDYSLWTLDASGGAPERVPANGWKLMRPTYAPRARRLVYENWSYDTNIWRVPATPTASDAPAAPLITSTSIDMNPSYSPDGRHLAFTSMRSGDFEIWIGEADGARPVQVTTLHAAYIGVPHWAPDNRHLVVDANLNGQSDVYIINIETKIARQLTDHPYNDLASGWSPDGRWIYFASEQTGTWQIWKMPSAGGMPQQVTQHGGYVAAASTNGTDLYYSKTGQTGEGIWRIPVGGGEETQIVKALSPYDWGNWKLVDRHIYFLYRPAADSLLLACFDLDTGETQPMAPLDAELGYPGLAVSPDEQWLLYTRTDHEESDLMLVEY